MRKSILTKTILGFFMSFFYFQAQTQAQNYPETEWKTPKIVTPGAPMTDIPSPAPSDAIILFDGKDLSQWQNVKGEAAGWDVNNGIITVNKKAGDIRTKEEFSDFQLHIEWRVPKIIHGEGQARGNSGIFLQGLYEIQILDSYNNPTYVNGQAASVYRQTPPLVNAMRQPGEWNTYDIVYTAPTFKDDSTYRTHPTVTLFHNGILVQNNTTIIGTTYKDYLGFTPGQPHGKGPIILQAHTDPSEPISFRNIWIRKL